MFNSTKKLIYSTCIIFLFGIIIPVWIASVKVEAIKSFSLSPLADPVTKVIGNTRKFLLSRVEGSRLHEKVILWSQKTGVVEQTMLSASSGGLCVREDTEWRSHPN